MAATDKDIFQKERAIRFCVANDIVPFLEVNVVNQRELAEKPSLLTDIDVLGVYSNSSGVRRIIFDCKTSKISPINRAFWVAGLASYVDAAEAFVILPKAAPEAHRLSAKALGVHLFDEALFESYAEASNIKFHDKKAYLCDISRWISLADAYKANPALSGLEEFSRHVLPLDRDFAKSFRGILANLKHVRGELDPSKGKHQAIFAHAVFSATYVLSPLVGEFFNLFDPKQSKNSFEDLLRVYMWGGRESFKLRKKLRELMASVNAQVSSEVELPRWEDFIEIFRTFLDAPHELKACSLPLMELCLRYLGDQDPEAETLARARFIQSNRVRQFIFRLSSYIAKAAALPKEFDENLRQDVNTIMSSLA